MAESPHGIDAEGADENLPGWLSYTKIDCGSDFGRQDWIARAMEFPRREAGGRIMASENARLRDCMEVVALIILVLVSYSPVWNFDFVNLDDRLYVAENQFVKGGITPAGLRYAWTTFDTGNWIPLTWLSYQIDAGLFGEAAGGFHAMNLVWHIVNVILLFRGLFWLTGERGRSWLVAALFAVHPLHVESVAWISERKDVLSTFWLLAALGAYAHYAFRPSLARYGLVSGCFALGLLSKPMLVTAPVLMALFDIWPLGRWRGLSTESTAFPPSSAGKLVLEKLPLLLVAAVDAVITLISQGSANAVMHLEALPASHRVANAFRAYGWYLQKTFLPEGLCVFYPHPGLDVDWRWSLASTVLVVAISVVCLGAWIRQKTIVPLAGWTWFFIALVPVIGFLQVGAQAQADRYTYIPHLGLFVAIVWAAADGADNRRIPRSVRYAICGCLLGLLVMLTSRQVGTWKNSETLWRRALEVSSENFTANLNLGKVLLYDGRPTEADAYAQRALERKPGSKEAILLMGDVSKALSRWDQAESYYEWAARLDPSEASIASRLREIRRRKDALSRSSAPRESADVRMPSEAAAELKRGLQKARAGDMRAAVGCFLAALEISPDAAEAHTNAGLAFIELKDYDLAEEHLARAVELRPANADCHVNLAALYERQALWRQAREEYEHALRLRPHDQEAKYCLQRVISKAESD